MLFIAADCRAQERKGASGSSVTRRTSKKFSECAAVVLRLHSIGRQSVAVVSNVLQGGIVEALSPNSIGHSSSGDSAVQAAAGDESAVLVEENAAEGVDADDVTEHTEYEEVTAVAMSDPLTFAAKFTEAVIASGLDTDESEAPGPGTDAIETGLEKYQMGELPSDSNEDVPLDTMIGFRSMGGTLAELFDVDVVGRFAYDVHWRKHEQCARSSTRLTDSASRHAISCQVMVTAITTFNPAITLLWP
jgi:hypothetical protein